MCIIIRYKAANSAPYIVRYKYDSRFFCLYSHSLSYRIKKWAITHSVSSSWTNTFTHHIQVHLSFRFRFVIHIFLASGFKMNRAKKKSKTKSKLIQFFFFCLALANYFVMIHIHTCMVDNYARLDDILCPLSRWTYNLKIIMGSFRAHVLTVLGGT